MEGQDEGVNYGSSEAVIHPEELEEEEEEDEEEILEENEDAEEIELQGVEGINDVQLASQPSSSKKKKTQQPRNHHKPIVGRETSFSSKYMPYHPRYPEEMELLVCTPNEGTESNVHL